MRSPHRALRAPAQEPRAVVAWSDALRVVRRQLASAERGVACFEVLQNGDNFPSIWKMGLRLVL